MQSDANFVLVWLGGTDGMFLSILLYSFRFTSTSFKTGSWHIVSPGGCRLVGALFAPSPSRPKFDRGDRIDRGIMQKPAQSSSIAHCTLHIVQSHIARCTFYFGDPVRSPTTARLCIFAAHTNADMTSF